MTSRSFLAGLLLENPLVPAATISPMLLRGMADWMAREGPARGMEARLKLRVIDFDVDKESELMMMV